MPDGNSRNDPRLVRGAELGGSASDLQDIKARLTERIESLATTLLCEPTPGSRRRRDWHFPGHGGAYLVVRGRKRGAFYCHSGGQGGGALDLIMFARSCSFAEAVSWAKSFLRISDADPTAPVDIASLRKREQARVEAEREAAADELRRIAYARATWLQSAPIAGTVAERYLVETRAIPTPTSGWPDAVRFHPQSNSLVLAATTVDGNVQAVQRVFLTQDAKKVAATEAHPSKRTSGVMAGAVVRLPGPGDGPLQLGEGPETGLSAWAATENETWICLGGFANVPTLPTGRDVIRCSDDDRTTKEGRTSEHKLASDVERWKDSGAAIFVAWPWSERRRDGSDFNDVIKSGGVEAVREQLAAATECAIPAQLLPDDGYAPHYPRPYLVCDAASRRLQKTISGWFDRLERHLAARDWTAAETIRLLPDATATSAARIRAKLVRAGMDPDEADDKAAERAVRVAPGIAKRQARKGAVALFGRRAASGQGTRIQVKGAAGLGKTQAIIKEFLRRPSLWNRNIRLYARDLVLSDAFAADLMAAAAQVAPAPDGTRPRAMVIRGRQSKGMCDPGRLKIVTAAQQAGCDSIYRTCCYAPAVGSASESLCPDYQRCKASGYISQFRDDGPALRVLTHPRLSKTEPADLRMPAADAAIVDESAIGALVTSVVVDPALLTDLATYDSAPGEEHRIEEAEAIGRAVAEAVAGSTDAVAALRAAGVAPQHLREAAAAASLGADKARPAVHPGMPDMLARGVLARHRGHPGRGVAAVFTQLARDLEAGRSSSSGIEWDAKNTAKLDDGTKVPHPVIRRHGLAAVKGVPSTAPLLLLDADAELDINRRMFGDDGLRGFTVPAVRQAYVIQVSDAAVAKSSLAPGVRLRNNKAKAEKLRGRITELVQRETADGPRVLVIAPLQVRRALTGEMGDAVPVWTPWHGAELTHYGRHLGVNRWAEFDTVIIIGREELPPVVAERIARAIWADTPDVALNLPGEFGRELRRHDLRTGTAPAVSVRAHADPRVQSVIEISRECAMGQGADRLRLIHRDPAKPARVIVMSNLPVPGLVVDELLTLDDVLAGGTVWQRARAAVPAGVLPLSPDWLTANLSGLFPSRRTAARAVGELVPTGNIYPYCQVALIRTAGPGRPGKALVAAGVADPRGELARLLGCEVVGFRLPTQADEKPTAAKPEGAPKTEPVSVSPAKPAPAVEPEDDMPPDQLPAVATFATLRADTLPPFETVLPPATPAAPMLVPAPGARDRLGVLSARLEAARPLWCGCGCRSFWKPAGGPWTCASCYPAEDEVAAWTWVPSDVAVARAAARRTVGLAAYAARALEHGGGAARLCAAGV